MTGTYVGRKGENVPDDSPVVADGYNAIVQTSLVL